jgi:hypothetical protein
MKNWLSIRVFLIVLATLLAFIMVVLYLKKGKNANSERESVALEGSSLEVDAINNLSLAEQVKIIASELESASSQQGNLELNKKRERLEAIQKAQESSPLDGKSCESIIDGYEQAVRDFIEGRGNVEDYSRFNNDPFFIDCKNKDKIHKERIKEIRGVLREFAKQQQ